MAKKKKRTRRKTTRRAPRAGRGLAKVTVAALQAELNRRLESLQAKRDAVAAELEELETELAAYGGAPAPRRRARVGRPPKRRVGRPAKTKKRVGRPARKKRAGGKRPRNKLNLVDSLAKLLKNRTMSVTDMSEAVQKAGYKTSSPNFRTIVNQTLINNPKIFSRVARGQYTAK